MLDKLGLISGRSGARKEAGTKEDRMKQPEHVDAGEVALILLRNAVRMLDKSLAPPEVNVLLKSAILELEKHVSERSS